MTTTQSDRLKIVPSLAIKVPCLIGTTENITLSGLQTVDTRALEEGDRVLVKNQTDATTNGIYNASFGSWARASDFNGAFDATQGTEVVVVGGTQIGRWQVSTVGEIVFGTSDIDWAFAGLPVLNVINLSLQGDGFDNSSAIQMAIDAAPSGSYLKVETPGIYYFRNIVIEKPLTIDWSKSTLLVKPTGDGVTTGNPAIWFKGQTFTPVLMETPAALSNSITLTTAADAALIPVGSYVRLSDNKVVRAWDDLNADGSSDAGSSAASTGYAGRSEVIRVIASNSGTGVLQFDKPIEYLYDKTDGATVTLCSMVSAPSCINIGLISEVDPGGIHTGPDIQQAPHLIKFDYCIAPYVADVYARYWQLHVVNFDHCLQSVMERVSGDDPYRPTSGGHGYLQRFNRSTGGIARDCTGKKVRHLVDFCQAYDCTSQGNSAYDSAISPFAWHGLGSHRCKSLFDTVYAATDATTGAGFTVGNPTFANDDDSQIICPRYIGGGDAIKIGYLSARTFIFTPEIKGLTTSGARNSVGITICTGAVDTRVSHGQVDWSSTDGAFDYPISIRGEHSLGDTFYLPPINNYIDNVKVVANVAGTAAINANRYQGICEIKDCETAGGANTNDALNLSAAGGSTALTDLRLINNSIGGTWNRGITVTLAPTKSFYVVGNRNSGTLSGNLLNLVASSLLMDFLNGNDGTAAVNMNGASGTNRSLIWKTASLLRWIFRANSTAEGGANAGSDLELVGRDDTGAALYTFLLLTRSTGVVEIGDRTQKGVHRWNSTVATTVGAAGAASALPATPVEYMRVNISGNIRKIPCYND